MKGMTRSLFVVIVLMLGCGGGGGGGRGGGGKSGARDTLTERQRDSILAKSSIPGAGGIGSAMRVADSTNARIRATDSVPQ